MHNLCPKAQGIDKPVQQQQQLASIPMHSLSVLVGPCIPAQKCPALNSLELRPYCPCIYRRHIIVMSLRPTAALQRPLQRSACALGMMQPGLYSQLWNGVSDAASPGDISRNCRHTISFHLMQGVATPWCSVAQAMRNASAGSRCIATRQPKDEKGPVLLDACWQIALLRLTEPPHAIAMAAQWRLSEHDVLMAIHLMNMNMTCNWKYRWSQESHLRHHEWQSACLKWDQQHHVCIAVMKRALMLP